jgi:hypothetical protein
MSGPKRVDRTLVSMKLPDWLIAVLDECAASYGLSRTGAAVLLSRIGHEALRGSALTKLEIEDLLLQRLKGPKE